VLTVGYRDLGFLQHFFFGWETQEIEGFLGDATQHSASAVFLFLLLIFCFILYITVANFLPIWDCIIPKLAPSCPHTHALPLAFAGLEGPPGTMVQGNDLNLDVTIRLDVINCSWAFQQRSIMITDV
jgi:hypothetical protein